MTLHPVLPARALVRFFAALLAVLLSLPLLHAQPNPRHPYSQKFQEIWSQPPNEAYKIWPLGDISGDGISDFALRRASLQQTQIYHGTKGSLPPLSAGQRIGIAEGDTVSAEPVILTVGDWDGQNGPDICTRIERAQDTGFGNTDGYHHIYRLVVFWNNGHGEFSTDDSTHLSPGIDASIAATMGASGDLDGDGVEDLIVNGYLGYSHGVLVYYAGLHVYRGHHLQRWGRGAIANTPDWQWWNIARDIGGLSVEDLDADGHADLIVRNYYTGNPRLLSVFYGRSDGQLPDTLADLEQIDLYKLGGQHTLFSDVTGDHIPDLVVLRSQEDEVRIYVGCKGQRLMEQFGSGDDPPSGRRWWGKPWARLMGPHEVRDVWPQFERLLFDFGSADSNETEELWVVSQPFLLAYDVGGYPSPGNSRERWGLDSLFDGEVIISPVPWDGVLLGDIDGDGREEFAITNFTGVHIYRKVDQLPTTGGSAYRVPDGHIKPSSVEEGPAEQKRIELKAVPNPSSAEVRIQWNAPAATTSTVVIHDMLGQEVTRIPVPSGAREVRWDASETFGGRYFITLRIGEAEETTAVFIQQ